MKLQSSLIILWTNYSLLSFRTMRFVHELRIQSQKSYPSMNEGRTGLHRF